SLRGWVGGNMRFHFEYNFASLAGWLGLDPTIATKPGVNQQAVPTSAPKDNPITECHITYKIPCAGIDVKVGYMKVPFALNSLSDKLNLAFLQRTKFDNSDYDPRRDAGIQLYKDFWHKRIKIWGGIFSGMGENIIYGIQDPQGRFEYAGRVELSNTDYKW